MRECIHIYIENNKRWTRQANFVVFSVDFYAFHCYYYFVFIFTVHFETIGILHFENGIEHNGNWNSPWFYFFTALIFHILFCFKKAKIKHPVWIRVHTFVFCIKPPPQKKTTHNTILTAIIQIKYSNYHLPPYYFSELFK